MTEVLPIASSEVQSRTQTAEINDTRRADETEICICVTCLTSTHECELIKMIHIHFACPVKCVML